MNAKDWIGVPEPGDKVLWIRFAGFGDVFECVADAYNFKKRFPEIHLTFLSSPECSELIRVQPYIDDAFPGRKKPYSNLWKTLQNIRAGHYKWLINDHRGGKSSLLSLFSRAKHRIGSCYLNLSSMNRNYYLNLGIYHTSLEIWSQRCGVNLQDRSAPSFFASAEDLEAAVNLLERLPERRLFTIIGAGKVRKMWTTEGWIKFLRPLAETGWGIVLNGHGPMEETIGRQIEDALPPENVLNLVGNLDFKKMSGVVCRCTLAMGNDTGPLHLAALSGVPTLGIFNHPAGGGTEKYLLGIPWFRVLCAKDYVKGDTPLKSLPAEPVMKAFNAFAEEFLPRAFEWRNNRGNWVHNI